MTDPRTPEQTESLEAILLNVRTTLRLLEAITQWQRCAVRYCEELAMPHPDALAALEVVVGRDAAALDALMHGWPGPIANWRPGDPVPSPPTSALSVEPRSEEPGES